MSWSFVSSHGSCMRECGVLSVLVSTLTELVTHRTKLVASASIQSLAALAINLDDTLFHSIFDFVFKHLKTLQNQNVAQGLVRSSSQASTLSPSPFFVLLSALARSSTTRFFTHVAEVLTLLRAFASDDSSSNRGDIENEEDRNEEEAEQDIAVMNARVDVREAAISCYDVLVRECGGLMLADSRRTKQNEFEPICDVLEASITYDPNFCDDQDNDSDDWINDLQQQLLMEQQEGDADVDADEKQSNEFLDAYVNDQDDVTALLILTFSPPYVFFS